MKFIATLLLSACSLVALAQHKTKQSLHQDIDDDGKTLTVNISGTSGGKNIQYYRQFIVTGMNKQKKDAMLNRITDSLGINRHNNPSVPPAPAANSSSRSVTSSVHSSVKEHNDTMAITINGTINNEPVNYNRNFKVKGLSKQQKDAIVRRITDSLGIGPVPSK